MYSIYIFFFLEGKIIFREFNLNKCFMLILLIFFCVRSNIIEGYYFIEIF